MKNPDGPLRAGRGAGSFVRRILLLCAGFVLVAGHVHAGLLDIWRADDLILNDGDAVGSWGSASNRTVTANTGEQPTLKLNATPAGNRAVSFNGSHRMASGASPVGGRTAFSIAVVFKPSAAGANNSAQWWGKTGLVDAEEPSVVSDWGTVITETGQVGIGTGNPDNTTYSSGASLVDGSFHVAVFTWGGGVQSVYLDGRNAVTQSAVSTLARNNAGISFGGIRTGEANRRFNGDIAEIRFYDHALTAAEATNLVADLTGTYVLGNVPRITSFTASTNQIYLGAPVTLSWAVTNATSVVIDNGVGPVSATNSLVVNPTSTRTYTLTASNAVGIRTAAITIEVDPGVPSAVAITTNTVRNTALPLVLWGTDPNGGILNYSIVSHPAHGSLSGTPPSVTYTPAAAYEGFDSFTFKVNDGQFDSAPAAVTIKVIPPPTAPSAIALSSTNIPAGAAQGSFIAGISAVDVNNEDGDSQTFTLVSGFGNNSQFTVSGNVLSASPSYTGGVGATFSVRLRATDSTGLAYEQTFALRAVAVERNVVINEMNYNGANNTVRDGFIELHNPATSSVDVSAWRLTGGVELYLPPNTILPPNGYLVVAENPSVMSSVYGVAALGPWNGGLNNEGERVRLVDAQGKVVDEVDFRSEFPWPVMANGEGPTMQLVNAALDNDLGSSWRSAAPTPGAINAVFAVNAAPNIRQVNHTPQAPRSTQPVTITCKVTDPEGVTSVVLAYQVVAPGAYIPARLPLTAAQLNSFNTQPLTNALNPAFESAANWTSVPMHDNGMNGDAVAGDGIYSALVPQRPHRTLMRYRITCTDTLGASRRAPFEDDPALNFAYFVYDDMPNYLGFSSNVLASLPTYFVITRDVDMAQCTAWYSGVDQLPAFINNGPANDGRLHFNWEAAFVYEGKVFDHINYRLRGANGRYHPGKRSFRFKFNEGSLFQARDNNGKKFPTKWREVVTGKGQSNRGTQNYALNEVISFYLFNKVDVPAPETVYLHLRVIRGANETGSNQYDGDFWGLTFAQEKYDTHFLDAHDLPKGNLYKLNDHRNDPAQESRYQGRDAVAVTNGLDYWNAQTNLNGFRDADWLNAHANYTNWYRFHAISEAIRNYDTWPSGNKNGVWYFEPIYAASNSYLGRLMVLPYDLTDTWGPTWNGGEDLLFNGIFPSTFQGGDQGEKPEMQKEFRNVTREIRDLLFQPDSINAVIDAHAGVISAFVPADLARWSNAPSPASYVALSQTLGTYSPGITAGLPGYAQDLKRFMFTGGNYTWWIDRQSVPAGGWVTRLDTIAADANIPARPTVTYAGTNGFPVDGLLFQSSEFSDPNGPGTFAAMRWRIAEVNPPGVTYTNPSQLKLEWDAAWDSGEIPQFNPFVTIPDYVVQPDRVYRVRVKHMDNTGRWSQWSEAVEFRPSPRDTVAQLRSNLVISEIMYNPPGQGATSGDEFEFLELMNVGSIALNLSGLYFSEGITFSFTNGTALAPGATFVLARNPTMFSSRYPGVAVRGVFSGKLDNAGETLTISHPVAGEVLSLTYDDRAPWPATPDGFGFSLVLADPATGAYVASSQRFGNPGVSGGANMLGGVVINEILSSSTPPAQDMIELLNIASTNVDVSYWFISDDPGAPQKYRIPAGTILQPGQFLIITENQFNPTPGLGVSFGLSSFGEEVYLFSANNVAQLTGYSHGYQFGAAADGVSFGRHINSMGEEDLVLQSATTFGSPNATPLVGPVVISEIHYHPRATNDSFLELYNPSGNAVRLFDPVSRTNTWKIGGLAFTFPTNVTIQAGGFVLLVNDVESAFRTRWEIPPAVQIFAYSGNLQNSGEMIRLEAPDAPTTNGVPYYAVDRVRYNDRKPWPLAADGAGASLQRVLPNEYGNDPANWIGAIPTPASFGTAGVPPSFTQHPVTQTNATAGSVTFTVAATGTSPIHYQWRFNGGNLAGATNPVLVLNNLQGSDSGTYQAVAYNMAGATDSSNALLVVRAGPTITNHPTNLAVRIRPDPAAALTTNVTFRIGAVTYNPPLNYRWTFNDTIIPGATNDALTITNVSLAHEGVYRATVTDAVGSLTSTEAMLIPIITPVFSIPPVAQSAVTGSVVSLSALLAGGNPKPITWEWRRITTLVDSNVTSDMFSFLTFTNTNNVGSTTAYRVFARTPYSQASATANITTLADADGDGLADAWETQFGATDRNADDDGDGASNWQEHIAGTDPTNSASVLKILALVEGTGTMISFPAMSNNTYSVLYTDSLNPALWSRLADVFARPSNRVESVADPLGTTNRFYRIVTPRQ